MIGIKKRSPFRERLNPMVALPIEQSLPYLYHQINLLDGSGAAVLSQKDSATT